MASDDRIRLSPDDRNCCVSNISFCMFCAHIAKPNEHLICCHNQSDPSLAGHDQQVLHS